MTKIKPIISCEFFDTGTTLIIISIIIIPYVNVEKCGISLLCFLIGACQDFIILSFAEYP